MGRIDHIKDSLKSIGKPLFRKVRVIDHGRVTPHERSPRNKRKINSTASKDQALKRSKICKKRSRHGSDHQDRKRRAPEQGRGVKRSINGCLIAGLLRLQADPEWKLLDVITRPVRPERQREDATNKRRNQSGRIKPIQGDLAHTIYGAVYKKNGIPEELSNIEIKRHTWQHIPEISLSMEQALNGIQCIGFNRQNQLYCFFIFAVRTNEEFCN
ncbi:hypothetical protein TNCV_5139531 [Trichonephila clavipes]|nr:hypothetical protein TNCV_5139531 [Trichonephila clavipes]